MHRHSGGRDTERRALRSRDAPESDRRRTFGGHGAGRCRWGGLAGAAAAEQTGVTAQATLCAAGSYRVQSRCVPASRGHFVPWRGAVRQRTCPAGTYQNLRGRTSCRATRPGRSVASPPLRRPKCRPGSYQPLARRSACRPASWGHFVAGIGKVRQTPCPAGSANPVTGRDRLSACAWVGPGRYSGVGAATPPSVRRVRTTRSPEVPR